MKFTFVRHGPEISEFAEDDLTPLKENEVLVRTCKSLISVGTELAFLSTPGKRRVGRSGYCNVGEVVAVGSNAHRYKVGQRVLHAISHMSHYCLSEEHIAYPIPDEVADEQAVFCELGCVAMHIIQRSAVSLGRTVVVVGQGTVGQLVNQVARLAGANRVIGVDLQPDRLDLARRLGADEGIAPSKDELAGVLQRGLPDACPPVFVEVSGSVKSRVWILDVAPLHSRVVVTGTYTSTLTVNPFDPFILREIDVVVRTFPNALNAASHTIRTTATLTISMFWMHFDAGC